MICERCQRTMVELFYSAKCDWCEFGPDPHRLHCGYVILSDVSVCEGLVIDSAFVFRSPADAEKFREAACATYLQVREVASLHGFMWRRPEGLMGDIVVSDGLFEVWSDHRYPYRVGRVHLVRSGSNIKLGED